MKRKRKEKSDESREVMVMGCVRLGCGALATVSTK
jgi:hypothetical protein